MASSGVFMVRASLLLLAAATAVIPAAPARAQSIFSSAHAPAATPALPPAEAQKRFVLPPGFEARLFAAEPDVVNPVAMTWDERGRLWVVELFQYPKKAPPGTPGRDRIKILEDTNNDGRADKVTIFAEGLNLATGILIGRGGVFVAQAPELLFLQDTNGDGKADKRTALLTGFATHDTHELLNGLTWGPDGWMYFTHGVFNQSKVRTVANDGGAAVDDGGTDMTAAVARFDPDKRRFQIFADGTSNPWGVDFDRAGNAFISACVIDHLFHVSPGGVYVRQAGTPTDAYAYDLLPSIVDHKHQRAAYAGVQVYEGDQYPAEYRGTVFMGNIHGNAVNHDRLTAAGATFRATAAGDFLGTSDGWFRPVSEQVGPDGNLWIADWYDKYPCYQNAMADPEGVDRHHGRIWRIVYTGKTPGVPRPSVRPGQGDLSKRSSEELVRLLSHPNVWQRRTAQRLLGERRDAGVRTALLALLAGGKTLEARLGALWTLHAAGHLDEVVLDGLVADREPAVRTWAARLTGERHARAGASPMDRLVRLARDPDAGVRAGVAAAARAMSDANTLPALTALAEQPNTGGDRVLSFLIWRAVEPALVREPGPVLAWLSDKGPAALPFSGELARKSLRRLCSTDARGWEQAVAFLARLHDKPAALVAPALTGLSEGLTGQTTRPGAAALAAMRTLGGRPEPEVAGRARRISALWGDAAATRELLAAVQGRKGGNLAERVQAIEIAGDIKGAATEKALAAALSDTAQPAVVTAALRSLGKLGAGGTPALIVKSWKRLPPDARVIATDVLASRPAWALALLAGVQKKTIAATDISLSVRRSLNQMSDRAVRTMVTQVLGNYRDVLAEKRTIIGLKKRMVMNGPVDLADGRATSEKICQLCHKFMGEGGDVGPDLTGSGRANLDALLANVIDPNQVIGKGYEQVTVTTKDQRMVSGRLVENVPDRVTLVGLNLKETIARANIAALDVSETSVMPEGLEQFPDAQFRNLIWYILQPPQDPAPRLRVELRDKALVVLQRPVRTQPTQPAADRRPAADRKDWIELATYVMDPGLRPYLHPLRDPTGAVVLTEDRPGDHPWQHGVFTGLHKVNGADFWSEKEGKQRFVRLLDIQTGSDRVSWRALVEWVGPDGAVVLEEEQAIAVNAPTADGYSIDFDWTLRPKTQPVTFGRYDYGGLSVRMPVHADHTHLNATGARGKDAATQRASWCTVERPFGDTVWGIAVLDHPGNDRAPAAWRVDQQGMINPSPSLQGDWQIPGSQQRTFHYRLAIYRGAANAGRLAKAQQEFAALGLSAARSLD